MYLSSSVINKKNAFVGKLLPSYLLINKAIINNLKIRELLNPKKAL